MGKSVMKKYWWSIVVRGIAAVLFAILAIFWTKFTLELLLTVFGVFILVDGIVSIFGGINAAKEHHEYWLYVLRGIVGILLGMITIFWPGITGLFLAYIIAIWAILIGFMEIWISSKFTHEVDGKWIMTTSGVLSIIIGIIILIFPSTSLITITWIIGLFALIFGVGAITFGFQVKK